MLEHVGLGLSFHGHALALAFADEDLGFALDSPYLMKLGLSVTARRGTFTVTAAVNALRGDEASTGINPQLSIGYGF